MIESENRYYHDQVDPITADKRDFVLPRSNLRRQVVPLDAVLTEKEYRIRGDFVIFDFNSTGVATIKLNNTSEDPWPAIALAGMVDSLFENVYISASAQPGKFLNMWYGYKARFLNPVQALASIGSILNPVSIADTAGNTINTVGQLAALPSTARYLLVEDVGIAYGSAFSSVAVSGGATALVIVAPGSNTSGLVVVAVEGVLTTASVGQWTVLAKAGAAPAGLIDGDVLWMVGQIAVGGTVNGFPLREPSRIAASKGLYKFNGVLETAVVFKALYNLL